MNKILRLDRFSNLVQRTMNNAVLKLDGNARRPQQQTSGVA